MRDWKETWKERFWRWVRDRIGVTDVLEKMATSAQIGQTCREIGELADDLQMLRLAVADLREQLHLDPLVEADLNLDDFRIPSGDPTGL